MLSRNNNHQNLYSVLSFYLLIYLLMYLYFQIKVQVCVQFFKVGEIDTLKEQYTADVIVRARWREPSLDHQLHEVSNFTYWWNNHIPWIFIYILYNANCRRHTGRYSNLPFFFFPKNQIILFENTVQCKTQKTHLLIF